MSALRTLINLDGSGRRSNRVEVGPRRIGVGNPAASISGFPTGDYFVQHGAKIGTRLPFLGQLTEKRFRKAAVQFRQVFLPVLLRQEPQQARVVEVFHNCQAGSVRTLQRDVLLGCQFVAQSGATAEKYWGVPTTELSLSLLMAVRVP